MKKISKKTVIIIASVFVIGLVGSLIPSDEEAPAPVPEKAKVEVIEETPSGIDGEFFNREMD